MDSTPSNTSPAAATQVVVPKDNSNQVPANSPPPAYTPRTQPNLTTLAARVIQSRQGNMPVVFQQGAPYTTLLSGTADEDDEDEEPVDNSPISLRITTAINISQDNNVVCLTATPAEQANAIAQAVVKAIQENSSGRCGNPMVDEQGCPRPLKIEVDAGMHVEGSGNVIGTQEAINDVLRQRGQLRRRREEVDGESSESSAKRRRLSE